MKANFFNKEGTIYVYVTIDGKKHKHTTKIKCDKKDFVNGYPKRTQTLIIQRLQKIEKPLNEHLQNDEYTPHTIKKLVDELVNGKVQNKLSISNLVNHYIDIRKQEMDDGDLQPVTFEKIKLHVEDFGTWCGIRTIRDLNNDLMNKVHTTKEKKNKNNQSYFEYLKTRKFHNNTCNSYIKNVQAFLNWLHTNNHIQNKILIKRFQHRDKDIFSISIPELRHLQNMDFKNEKLERVVDLFIFGCYTGLRFSDIQSVNIKMIDKHGNITIKQQKTGDRITYQLSSIPLAILKKYDYKLPQISNQKANVYIKEAFLFAGLNRYVYINDELTPLAKVVSFHIARKSFISIALTIGNDSKLVMAISGHKSAKVFQRYIDFSESMANKTMSTMDIAINGNVGIAV